MTRSEPQRLRTIPGYETVVLPYCTDIPHLKTFGEALLFGPGSILVAHTDQERIAKQEMYSAVAHYQNIVLSLLKLNQG
jgi:acetylornithine deacetylase